MGQTSQVNINNQANYKSCQKKQYEIHVCMPPKGTVVINKLEQSEVVKRLNGKTYFTLEELNSPKYKPLIPQIQQAAQQGMCYVVDDNKPFVLAGTEGEMWIIDGNKLANTYTWADGTPINEQTLNKKKGGSLELNWASIKTKPVVGQSTTMACFVPKTQKFQVQTSWGSLLQGNVGQGHGLGDFVVCAKLPNGQPNLQDRWIVNGRIFAATYNNQGWSNCVETNNITTITIESLPNLCSNKNSNLNTLLSRFNKFRLIASQKDTSKDDIAMRVSSYFNLTYSNTKGFDKIVNNMLEFVNNPDKHKYFAQCDTLGFMVTSERGGELQFCWLWAYGIYNKEDKPQFRAFGVRGSAASDKAFQYVTVSPYDSNELSEYFSYDKLYTGTNDSVELLPVEEIKTYLDTRKRILALNLSNNMGNRLYNAVQDACCELAKFNDASNIILNSKDSATASAAIKSFYKNRVDNSLKYYYKQERDVFSEKFPEDYLLLLNTALAEAGNSYWDFAHSDLVKFFRASLLTKFMIEWYHVLFEESESEIMKHIKALASVYSDSTAFVSPRCAYGGTLDLDSNRRLVLFKLFFGSEFEFDKQKNEFKYKSYSIEICLVCHNDKIKYIDFFNDNFKFEFNKDLNTHSYNAQDAVRFDCSGDKPFKLSDIPFREFLRETLAKHTCAIFFEQSLDDIFRTYANGIIEAFNNAYSVSVTENTNNVGFAYRLYQDGKLVSETNSDKDYRNKEYNGVVLRVKDAKTSNVVKFRLSYDAKNSSIRVELANTDVDRSYTISPKNSVQIIQYKTLGLIYKTFHISPVKEIIGSRRFWERNIVAKCNSFLGADEKKGYLDHLYALKTFNITSINCVEYKQISDICAEIRVNFLHGDTVIGSRLIGITSKLNNNNNNFSNSCIAALRGSSEFLNIDLDEIMPRLSFYVKYSQERTYYLSHYINLDDSYYYRYFAGDPSMEILDHFAEVLVAAIQDSQNRKAAR